MKYLRWLPLCVVGTFGSALAQKPRRLATSHVSPAVWGVLETPASLGSHPGLIILPGSAGWRPAYAALARVFADSGFLTLALDYYAETGRDSTAADDARMRPVWQQTIKNAVNYLRKTRSGPGRKVALLGFSRGAFLAVDVAGSTPGVGAIIDFFGGGAADGESLKQEVQGIPPLLILHGDSDKVVPVEQAYRLRDAVLAQGGRVEMHIYSAAQHGFNVVGSESYSEAAAEDAWRQTFRFLRTHLTVARRPGRQYRFDITGSDSSGRASGRPTTPVPVSVAAR